MIDYYKDVDDYVDEDGKLYKPLAYYCKKYDLNINLLHAHKYNGLTYINEGRYSFINEDDFHDYFAGKIGNPTKEWVRWKKIKESYKKGV